MILGKRQRTVEVKRGLTDDNEPMFEGVTLHKGKIQFSERIKQTADCDCVTCGQHSSTGVYKVGVTEYGLLIRIFRTIDFINYTCLSCLNDSDPVTYPYQGLDEYLGGIKKSDS